jgi:hypothetical protein
VKGAGLFGLDNKLIVNQSNPRRRSALAGSRKVGDRRDPTPPACTRRRPPVFHCLGRRAPPSAHLSSRNRFGRPEAGYEEGCGRRGRGWDEPEFRSELRGDGGGVVARRPAEGTAVAGRRWGELAPSSVHPHCLLLFMEGNGITEDRSECLWLRWHQRELAGTDGPDHITQQTVK